MQLLEGQTAPSMGEGEFYELEGEKNRLAVSRSYNRIM